MLICINVFEDGSYILLFSILVTLFVCHFCENVFIELI